MKKKKGGITTFSVVLICSILLGITAFICFFIILNSHINNEKRTVSTSSVESQQPGNTNVESEMADSPIANLNSATSSSDLQISADLIVTESIERDAPSLQNNSSEPNYLLDYSEINVFSLPEYDGSPYIVLNDNIPEFKDEDLDNPIFERYSDLDSLGRCGVATAFLGKELMPTEKRGYIGNVKPSGWHTVKYPDIIADLYLYNRCHLIAYSLAGENDNEKNLITGTRYMNMSGMLPFENDIVSYIENTGNHVLYRVTPCFVDQELLARGVHMEAISVEDEGKGICFNIFVYNVQPGISIDYATGESCIDAE